MTASLLPQGKQYFETAAGTPAVGWKIYTYDTGTNNPRTTWQDAGQVAPNLNPVVLDARGEAVIFWSGAYRVRLEDNLGNTIWTVDGVTFTDVLALLASTTSGADGASLVGFLQSGVGAQGRTVAAKLKNILTVFDFMTPAQITDVESGAGTIDVTSAIQAAITAAGATKRRRIYAPAGVYKHVGFNFPLSGVGMFGDGDNETVFAYAGGAADTVTVASAAHRVTLERMTLRGNAAATSVLKWTAAADGALNRVLVEAGGCTQPLFILQEGSFYFVCEDSMFDGALTSPMGVLLRNNGAASGPNSSVFRDTRVQQVTQCFDVRDGNNLKFDSVYMENTVTLGARIWAPIRNAFFTGCRVDTAVNGAIGVQVDVGAQDTILDETQWDMSGVAPVLLADSGTRTQRREGSQLIGKPIISPAARIVDVAGNAFLELHDNGGQVALIQYTSNLLDLFSATGKAMRFRTNGGTATPLQFGAGNTLGAFGTAAIAKPTVTGAKGGNAALTSLCTQLAALGFITDSTT